MINLLDMHIANLIAAGEVVDKPASALKELVENAIDAGSANITVEIKSGGIEYIRVTDNGVGMNAEDLGRSILRHATSKIKSETDLEKIQTLGFRGEALAAISSVTDLKIFTKMRENPTGFLLEASSGQNVSISETGCPDGTTVVIERMFSKIPARQKFLKRDATEGMYCKGVIEKIAVSNPNISFKFIQDGRQKIFTPGNGSLKDAVYSVFGGEIADNLICVEAPESFSEYEKYVKVSGYISRIEDGRKTRAEENFFVNGRHIYSKAIMSAVEEAYKSIAETSRFPFCVLNIKIDESRIDINVHPQKMEIKFSDEKNIYSAVYYAVKNALENAGNAGNIGNVINAGNNEDEDKDEKYKVEVESENFYAPQIVQIFNEQSELQREASKIDEMRDLPESSDNPGNHVNNVNNSNLFDDYKQSEKIYNYNLFNKPDDNAGFKKSAASEKNYKLLGEAFYGYIILEKDEKIVIIDKHAAHERIIYDIILKKMSDNNKGSQILLTPIEIHLNAEETAGILNIEQDLKKIGIEFEWCGDNILVKEVPSGIADADIAEIIKETAYKSFGGNFAAGDTAKIAELAASKYAACHAAMKIGRRDNPEDIIWLADRVMNYEDVKYCPHGRPIAFEISKNEIDKRFKR